MEHAAIAPGANALALTSQPHHFQFGPARYAYVHSETNAQWDGHPVYRCWRGRDDLPGLLYLLHHEGRWQACRVPGETPESAEDIIARMTPAFRAVEGVDVRLEGEHLWECWDDDNNRWWLASLFRTRVLS